MPSGRRARLWKYPAATATVLGITTGLRFWTVIGDPVPNWPVRFQPHAWVASGPRPRAKRLKVRLPASSHSVRVVKAGLADWGANATDTVHVAPGGTSVPVHRSDRMANCSGEPSRRAAMLTWAVAVPVLRTVMAIGGLVSPRGTSPRRTVWNEVSSVRVQVARVGVGPEAAEPRYLIITGVIPGTLRPPTRTQSPAGVRASPPSCALPRSKLADDPVTSP